MHGWYYQALFCALAFHFVCATAADSSGYSTLIYPTKNGNLTFALSATTSGDMYMHLSAPVDYSWVGVGTGKEMDGSVMWILYQGENKDRLTLSPRISHGHVEPSYSDRINCTLLNGGYYNTNDRTRYYTANIHCANLTAMTDNQGKLDMSRSKQDFLYAFGPSGSIGSDSTTAGIKRHDSYGNFWMDMTKSQVANGGAASVPSGDALAETSNAGVDGEAQSDGDKLGPSHAALMLATFVIIFPLGAVLLRFMNSVRAHYITQSIGALTSIIGLGLGVYLSTMYNKSKDFSTGHQIFGILITLLMLGQWSGGLFHHLQYRKYKKSTIIGKVHRVLGAIVILCGFINGFLGFDLSGNDDDNLWYGIVVAVILATVVLILGWKRWSNHKKQKVDTSSGERDFDHSGYRLNLIQQLHGNPGRDST